MFDAPYGELQSRWVIDAAKAKYPGKPISYLVLTHHHMDHTGGMRTYVAEGATVIVPAPDKAYFEAGGAGARTRSRRTSCRRSRARRRSRRSQTSECSRTTAARSASTTSRTRTSKGMLIAHVPRAEHRVRHRPDLAARRRSTAMPAPIAVGNALQEVQHHRRDHRRRPRHHRQAGRHATALAWNWQPLRAGLSAPSEGAEGASRMRPRRMLRDALTRAPGMTASASSGRSIAELLAQDALVEAVAGIEQHLWSRSLWSIAMSTARTSRTSSWSATAATGRLSGSSTSTRTRARVRQQRAAPAPRPERADRRQRHAATR